MPKGRPAAGEKAVGEGQWGGQRLRQARRSHAELCRTERCRTGCRRETSIWAPRRHGGLRKRPPTRSPTRRARRRARSPDESTARGQTMHSSFSAVTALPGSGILHHEHRVNGPSKAQTYRVMKGLSALTKPCASLFARPEDFLPAVQIARQQVEAFTGRFDTRLRIEHGRQIRRGRREKRRDFALQATFRVIAGKHCHVRRASGRHEQGYKSFFYLGRRLAGRHSVTERFCEPGCHGGFECPSPARRTCGWKRHTSRSKAAPAGNQ